MAKIVALKSSHTSKKQSPRQVPTKTAKRFCTMVPPPQVERIRHRYVLGQSIRKISREEKRDQGTVARIVKGPEMQAYVQGLREKYYGLGELALEALRRHLETSKDGRLAVEVLRSIGVIPTLEQAYANTQSQTVALVTEEDEVKAQMFKLVNAACERAKIFSQSLPSLEDSEPGVTMERPSGSEVSD